jgi:fatty acid desaturase
MLFFCLAWRGLVEKPWLRLPLWVVLVLLNFSLSIGIMHMHAHRKLFTDERANRVLEFLLSLPCSLSYPVMLYVHVYLHHRHDDGEGDPTSTPGKAGAFAAVWYWLRYADVTQTTIAAFARCEPGVAQASQQYRRRLGGAGDPRHLRVDRRMLLLALFALIVSTNIGFFASRTPAFRKGGTHQQREQLDEPPRPGGAFRITHPGSSGR